MCRWTDEVVGPTVGLPRHRHFIGVFNVPIQAPTWGHHFYSEMNLQTCSPSTVNVSDTPINASQTDRQTDGQKIQTQDASTSQVSAASLH